MSRTAVLCPAPPLLYRELGGAEDVAADVREAALEVLAGALAARPATVLVVGGAAASRRWQADLPVDVHPFGTTGRAAGQAAGQAAGPATGQATGQALPLSLGVGRRLLDESGWTGPTELRTLARDADDAEVEALAAELRVRRDVVLLLMGDGSACRGEKAPGFLDERAFPLDDVIADSLALGDTSALRTLDAQLCRELMVDGRDVLRLLGWLTEAPEEASLDYRDDPFGVSYFVASWRLGD